VTTNVKILSFGYL